MKKVIIIIGILVCYYKGKTQTISTITKMANEYQDCLDRGVKMLRCAIDFYYQMDSMLNVVYINLRKSLTKKEKETLKKEQYRWLQKRDNFFKKEDKISVKNYGDWGEDADMFAYDNKADFVKRRVIELIKRLKK